MPLWKEINVLFNDALNTFYLRLYGVGHMVKESRCRHIGYSFRLAARGILYAQPHRNDNTHQSRSIGWNENLFNASVCVGSEM